MTLAHPVELEDAPDFVSWPPRLPLETMVELSERLLRERAEAGWRPSYSSPIDVEFVL